MIDTSIYNRIQPMKVDSPLEAHEKLQQYRDTQQRNKLFDMKIAESERAAGRQNKLMQFSQAAGGDVNKLVPMLYQHGFLKEAHDIEKSQAELGKTRAEIADKSVGTGVKRGEVIGQALGSLMQMPSVTRDQVAQSMQHLVSIGALDESMAQAIVAGAPDDPAQMRAFLQTGRDRVMSAKDQVGAIQDQRNYDLDVQQFGETKRNNQEQNAISRGNLGVAQANLGLSRERLAVEKSNAAIGKAPTEFQGKSAGFGARAEAADKIISALGDTYSPTAINAKQQAENTWLVGNALGAAANKFMLSEADQKAEQAQRDFINAVLRQESGAAIGESEFENAKKQYFPQPGDGAAVIAQKAANRKTAIQGFKNNAGRAAFSAPAAPNNNDVLKAADAILGL